MSWGRIAGLGLQASYGREGLLQGTYAAGEAKEIYIYIYIYIYSVLIYTYITYTHACFCREMTPDKGTSKAKPHVHRIPRVI